MAQYSSPLLDDYNRTGVMTPGLMEAVNRVKQRLAPQPDANTATADQQQLAPALSHPQDQTPAINTPGQSAPMTQQPVANPTPALTHVPTPQEEHLTSLNRLQKSPSGIGGLPMAARIPLTVLDALGSAFLPGLTMGLPGTQLHHQLLVRQAEGAVKNDQGQQKAADESALQTAQTGEANARTESLLHPHTETKDKFQTASGGIYDLVNHKWEVPPPDKDKDQLLEVDPTKGKALGLIPSEDGKYYIPPQAAGELLKPAAPEKGPTNAFELWMKQNPNGKAEDWLKAETANKPETANEYADFKTGYLKEHPGATVEQLAHAFATSKQTPPDRGQNFVDPATNKMVRVEPGGNVPKGAVTAAGENTINTPATQQRNVASQASLVHEQTPMMLSEIDRLKDQIGPVSGRWNEFMQGHVGMDNPDMAGLRADLLMYSSAVALMHARGRLPENLREEFDRAINAPKQSPENLKAVISKIDQWASANMHSMGGGAGQGGDVTELERGPDGKLRIKTK